MDGFKLDLSPAPSAVSEMDYWPTPAWTTEVLLDAYPPPRDLPVIEPSAGDGAICRVLASRGYRSVVAVEIRKDERDRLRQSLERVPASAIVFDDWLKIDWASRWPGSSIVGNPPYSEPSMSCHVQHAIGDGAHYVAMLLPVTFPCSIHRRALNQQWPPNCVFWLAQRPSCTPEGRCVGKRDLAWCVWDRPRLGDPLVGGKQIARTI